MLGSPLLKQKTVIKQFRIPHLSVMHFPIFGMNIKPFHATVLFLYSLKTSEKQRKNIRKASETSVVKWVKLLKVRLLFQCKIAIP